MSDANIETSPAKTFESTVAGIRSDARAGTVFGEPFESHGKTYVPVATVSYGFGGGFGRHQGERGGGMGGGVQVTPLGFMEIGETDTKFIRIEPNWKRFSAVAFGFFLGVRFAHRWLKSRR